MDRTINKSTSVGVESLSVNGWLENPRESDVESGAWPV